jgi:hypothetical protein
MKLTTLMFSNDIERRQLATLFVPRYVRRLSLFSFGVVRAATVRDARCGDGDLARVSAYP